MEHCILLRGLEHWSVMNHGTLTLHFEIDFHVDNSINGTRLTALHFDHYDFCHVPDAWLSSHPEPAITVTVQK